jgi:hypothetical protein
VWVENVKAKVVPGLYVVFTIGDSKRLPDYFEVNSEEYSLAILDTSNKVLTEVSSVAPELFTVSSGLNRNAEVGIGIMQSLLGGDRTFAPSLYGRFPIRDDVYRLFGKTSAEDIGLKGDLINIAFYLAGGLGSVGDSGTADDGITGFGIGLDIYLFKQLRFTYGPYLKFEEGRGGIPVMFAGLTVQFN